MTSCGGLGFFAIVKKTAQYPKKQTQCPLRRPRGEKAPPTVWLEELLRFVPSRFARVNCNLIEGNSECGDIPEGAKAISGARNRRAFARVSEIEG